MSGVDLSGRREAHKPAYERAADLLYLAKREFAAERERWPLWLPAFLATGIAIYFALPFEPSYWSGLAAVVSAAGLTFFGRRHTGVLLVGLPLVAMSLGFTLAAWRTAVLEAPQLERRLGPVAVSGRVVEVEMLAKGRRVTLDRPVIERIAPGHTPKRVRVRLLSQEPTIRPGDHVRLRAMLLPPAAPVAPGAFDFQRHAYFLQLGAVGYAYGRVEVEQAKPSSFGLWLAALREHVAARVVAGLPGAEGGIAAALMTGERGAIPPDVIEAMRSSGLAHLLAISGLHLGLITGALFFGIRAILALVPFLALRYPIKKWAAFAAFVGAFFYLLVTNATVPTQRAFIMTGVVLLGIMLDRTSISMRMVCWAALVILMLQPESLLGPSFQLSFAAVLALIAAYEAWPFRLPGWARGEGWWRLPLYYFLGVAFTSLVTTLATIPYSLYHFDRLAAYGVVTNMIAVPVTALWVMPWAIVTFLLMPFGLEAISLQPMGWGLAVVIWSAKTIMSWPGSVTVLPAMPIWGVALVTVGLLWLCLWRRPWRWAGIAGMALGIGSIAIERPPDVIAAGDGQLFAVRGAGGHMLISPVRGNAFDVDTILKRTGQAAPDPWPKEGASEDGRLACDSLGCIYRVNGQLVAFVKDREALGEDCRYATVVISAVPVRNACPSAHALIDRFDLWRKGGHSLWLDPDGVRIESVGEWRGIRPWAPIRPARAVSTRSMPRFNKRAARRAQSTLEAQAEKPPEESTDE